MEQIARDLGIAQAVRQVDAQRAGMLVPGREIGLLGEVIDSHGAVSLAGILVVLVREGGRSSNHEFSCEALCASLASPAIPGCPAFAGHDSVECCVCELISSPR